MMCLLLHQISMLTTEAHVSYFLFSLCLSVLPTESFALSSESTDFAWLSLIHKLCCVHLFIFFSALMERSQFTTTKHHSHLEIRC